MRIVKNQVKNYVKLREGLGLVYFSNMAERNREAAVA